jgi:rod shape determining protein RodA
MTVVTVSGNADRIRSGAIPGSLESLHPIRRPALAAIDWYLILATLALCGIGLVCVYSATHFDPMSDVSNDLFLKKQILWIVLAIPLFIIASRTEYHGLLEHHRLIYGANIVLLTAVLVMGHNEVNGAQRWISLGSFRLQPSEFAKLAIIVTLTAYLCSRQSMLREMPTLLYSLLHVAVPVLIIFKQPDLGTALVIMCIWLVMTFVSGARLRHLAALLAIGAVLFAGLWVTGGIKEYQKDRLRVFLNAQADPQGNGYHVTQALDAIGSGRLWGKGLFHGTQGQLGFIPEQHTDFIFTIVGEELGFVGSAALVFLYAIFLWRGCLIALHAADLEGRLLASGIVSMFLYHVLVNIGMTIGIMPVTGVPLPFMSYGGSSMMANLTAVGLLQSIRAEQPRLAL